MQIITVEALSELMKSQDQDYLLIDVREEWELNICKLDEARHIPLGQLPLYADDLPDDKLIICMCHHGMRSLQAAQILCAKGKEKVANLKGGIDHWIRDVNPKLQNY